MEERERSRRLEYRDYLKTQMDLDRDRKVEDHKDFVGRPESKYENTLGKTSSQVSIELERPVSIRSQISLQRLPQ